MTEIRALSIAGPFAYLLADGWKTIELRSWKTNYRGLVLLHTSTTKEWDYAFELLDLTLEDCPKAAIQGAATLVDCVEYKDALQWERDLEAHQWLGDGDYEQIRHECYGGKNPFGHVFEHPILFEPAIEDCPGAYSYWLATKPKQTAAFKEALDALKTITPA